MASDYVLSMRTALCLVALLTTGCATVRSHDFAANLRSPLEVAGDKDWCSWETVGVYEVDSVTRTDTDDDIFGLYDVVYRPIRTLRGDLAEHIRNEKHSTNRRWLPGHVSPRPRKGSIHWMALRDPPKGVDGSSVTLHSMETRRPRTTDAELQAVLGCATEQP